MYKTKGRAWAADNSCLGNVTSYGLLALFAILFLFIVITLMVVPLDEMSSVPTDWRSRTAVSEEEQRQNERLETEDRVFAYLQAGAAAVALGCSVAAAVLMLSRGKDAGTARSKRQNWQWGDPDMISRFTKRVHHEYYYEKRVKVKSDD